MRNLGRGRGVGKRNLAHAQTIAGCGLRWGKMSEEQELEEKTFLFPAEVQFGYLPICSSHVEVSSCVRSAGGPVRVLTPPTCQISEDHRTATKRDPSATYAYGVVYSERPLKGTAEFEVELVSYGTGWSGTLKLGVMRCKTGSYLTEKSIPRYSPEGTHHCVWSSDKLHNRLTDCFTEQHYGEVNLDELRAGDRLGMRVTLEGNLEFFVNGRYQGVAAEDIYQKGHDVYAVVDHYANCKATKITRSGECTPYF